MDLERIEKAVREILEAIGEDPDRQGLRNTPVRVARMYQELFSGLRMDPARHLAASFPETYDELVVLRDVPFNSMCEHHLMPFEGLAHLAYLPAGTVQERLTSQIADLLMEQLAAKGVAIVLRATHTCMTCRGIKKAGSVMVTSAVRGRCKSDARTRGEVMSLLHS